jgi:two-component system CheB/CheR fusion protein
LFEEPPQACLAPEPRRAPKGGRNGAAAMKRELEDTRQQLQSIIDDLAGANEELQSANEEILSSNEELQSTNEELDTAKEELQSTNEELSTLNDELHGRNEELSRLNSDLVNLPGSVQIPIVMVANDLRIRRFTPAAERVLNIIPSDVGRPIGHLKPNFHCPDLEVLIREVVDTCGLRERHVEAHDGRMFVLQIRRYKTVENRIDGAVLTMYDVSSALKLARETGEAIISTVREPILLLSGDLRVQKSNAPFYGKFHVNAEEIEGRYVYDLGDGQWNIPDLRRLLEELLPERKNFDGFQVDHDFPRIGKKRMLLDGRRIESGQQGGGVILLMVRDITSDAS